MNSGECSRPCAEWTLEGSLRVSDCSKGDARLGGKEPQSQPPCGVVLGDGGALTWKLVLVNCRPIQRVGMLC